MRYDASVVLEAHSTATLITSGPFMMLVDTSSPAYHNRLIEGLEALDISPREIDAVVNTHLHNDHVGNNDLFPHARKFARIEEDPSPEFEAIAEDRELRPGIRLIHTPGHTRGHLSVIVDTEDARYVIAGDAIPTQNHFVKWVAPSLRYDEAAALRSMRRIADEADIIIPGHGAPFPNDRGKHR